VGISILRKMSKVRKITRSYKPITLEDLHRLQEIAAKDRTDFFQRHPSWASLYADRLLCVALCQGAALHYIDITTGINDFDVYTFYAEHPKKSWYAKRLKSYDFGNPKFGKSVDRPDFIGRRVDVMARSLHAQVFDDPMMALHRYLKTGKNKTAQLLSQKAVILLEPLELLGSIIWPELLHRT
jgi:hypothetical protein